MSTIINKSKIIVETSSKLTSSNTNVITIVEAESIQKQIKEGVPNAVICQESAEFFMAIINQIETFTKSIEQIPIAGKFLVKALPILDDALTINSIYQKTTRYGFSEFSQSDIAGLAKVTLHLIEYGFLFAPVALGQGEIMNVL